MLIARAEGRRYRLRELSHLGIDSLEPALVAAAPALDLRIKLVGLLRRGDDGLRATLRPLAVARDSHLGNVKGDNTIVVLGHREVGEIVHLGPSSSPLPEAQALLSDLVGLFDLSQSWTGRYPRTNAPLPAPEFSRSLRLRGGEAEIADGDEGIPLLDSLL